MRKSGKIVAAAVCASLALPFVSGCKGKAEEGKAESNSARFYQHDLEIVKNIRPKN